MAVELQVLAWSVVVLFAYIVVQASLAIPAKGLVWNAGPRDDPAALGAHAARALRALINFKETYPAFVALALGLVAAGKAGGNGALGAELWIAGRIVYLPLYVFGVPWLRSCAWGVSFLGLVLMLLKLL